MDPPKVDFRILDNLSHFETLKEKILVEKCRARVRS